MVGGQPITGLALLEWARGVIDAVIDPTNNSGKES
jgi:transcription-repair coupling factor (superfamily II helicase)